jgi:hypothetical protein
MIAPVSRDEESAFSARSQRNKTFPSFAKLAKFRDRSVDLQAFSFRIPAISPDSNLERYGDHRSGFDSA